MRVGDLIRVKHHSLSSSSIKVWNVFMGKIGIIVGSGRRLHIPAFKVMLLGEVVEFDHDEIEVLSK